MFCGRRRLAVVFPSHGLLIIVQELFIQYKILDLSLALVIRKPDGVPFWRSRGRSIGRTRLRIVSIATKGKE